MKHPAIRLAEICPASDVLEAFMAKGRKMPARVAMIECRAIVEKMVKDRAVALIRPQIRDAIDGVEMDVMGGSIPSDPESLSDAYDSAIENLLDAHSASITQDLIGRFMVGTKFHLELPKGAIPEDLVIANAFADDVWRVLIHDGDEESETHVLSTAKILSAVGIVQDDLAELMGDMPETAPQQQEKESVPMIPMNDILNRLKDTWGDDLDEAMLKAAFEMASDADDGLAASGVVSLGIEMDDIPTLRLFAAKHGPKAGGEFIDAIKGAPYPADETDSAADTFVHATDEADAQAAAEPQDGDEETDPEMRAMMGLPPLPAAAAPPSAPSTPRAPGSKAPDPGLVDKKALTIIRQYVKMKDEDVAAGIGVSRQTYINYADPQKKPTLTATPEQKAFLLDLVTTAEAALAEARMLLGG